MKLTIHHPELSGDAPRGPRYWRSLDELAETPGFKSWLEREFPPGAAEMDGVDRRHFLKIMAAGFAFAGVGLAGCRRPEARIVAYSRQPEQIIPGQPTYYATSCQRRGDAIPLVVETHEARPTKLEGNPGYARYGGATDLITQASILDLYDPDRLTGHTRAGGTLTAAQVNDLLAGWAATYGGAGGAGLAFLAESSTSPSRARLVRALRSRMPQAIWAEFEAIDQAAPARAATVAAGRPARPIYDFSRAAVIVSLDGDFLAGEPGSVGHARGFAAGRRVAKSGDGMNRLYVAESTLTVTGANADHRLRLATSEVAAFAAVLAAKVFAATGTSGPVADAARAAAAGLRLNTDGWLAVAAEDLVANRGRGLVFGGSHLGAEVHALLLAVNQALGNLGGPVDVVATDAAAAASLGDLAGAMDRGAVKTLVILGGNPAYTAPVDLKFGDLLKKVPEVVRYGYHADETSAAAGVVLAATHFLESWGDARTADGTYCPVQPMIQPLFGGLQELEVLARIQGAATTDAYSLALETFREITGRADVVEFNRFLHDGVWAGTAFPSVAPAWDAARAARLVAGGAWATASTSKDSLEVRFVADAKLDDGRFANNGWLQECPDPINKLSWDNAIIVSPKLAGELGILPPTAAFQIAQRRASTFNRGMDEAFVADLTIGGRTIRGPLHIQPGLANYTVVLPLGYGRTKVGRVGEGAGFNAYTVRTGAAPFAVTGGQLVLVPGVTVKLANQQEHWSYEGREVYRENNLAQFTANPKFAAAMGLEAHTPPVLWGAAASPLGQRAASTPRGTGLYEKPDFEGTHQWGMSIDLNTCIGCNACILACQAENNIPIVGRDQVRRGREMHWIRLDRYYTVGVGADGSVDPSVIPEDPQVAIQPMTCQHCELAPCESVCPVNATVHDEEGLNVMAYNRCIGTRYCANNCPYKVRRFNFFDYNERRKEAFYQGPLGPKGMPELLKMVKNPDVTVRMRGVMEKCTFCVQRIQQAKIAQKVKAGPSNRVEVPDGTIKMACQQVCPTEAIVFGNIQDPESRVSQLKANPRDYAVLGYLNIRPRTTYLARVRNPNPKMGPVLKALGLPDVTEKPLGYQEYRSRNYPAGFTGLGPGEKAAAGKH